MDTRLLICVFSLSLLWINMATAVGFEGIPGSYCSQLPADAGGCCLYRNDECAVDIRPADPETQGDSRYDTLCYCDDFCDRRDDGDIPDCCPDFYSHCRGISNLPTMTMESANTTTTTTTRRTTTTTTTTTAPDDATWTIPQPDSDSLGCWDGDKLYEADNRMQKNCRVCTCRETADADDKPFAFDCDNKIECLIDEDIIIDINSNPDKYRWKASNYSFMWGLTLEEGCRFRLGTKKSFVNMLSIRTKPQDLPDNFDARLKWPGLIQEIRDQGNCAVSWAFSTAAVAADRIAIMSKGSKKLSFSVQQLMSCETIPAYQGCKGGLVDRAWQYFTYKGVLQDECYPFGKLCADDRCPGRSGYCPVETVGNTTGVWDCPNRASDQRILYTAGPPYLIDSKEDAIMSEIYRHGPVQAVFQVFPDFFMYRSGVYHVSSHARLHPRYQHYLQSPNSYHSTRIIGWGIDHTDGISTKYWLCMNSWGTQWGEDGTFRILRGKNEAEIESFVVSVLSYKSLSQPNKFSGKPSEIEKSPPQPVPTSTRLPDTTTKKPVPTSTRPPGTTTKKPRGSWKLFDGWFD
ncbi:uncharacterized peptidase C1-like protein F26E4.3 [Paramacrobiotus metropolitanus]|uniref:uncharacterized peptidase C1-like protein F26E4.3 n=1 Tax=Paramacrobiotus metropolitanus TaxID=2943436 RepID=UPI002445BD83|nr:uncharacterized peptidase C1-like protein F26E4.3 [Paramacrobiotus metropolitanus]